MAYVKVRVQIVGTFNSIDQFGHWVGVFNIHSFQ